MSFENITALEDNPYVNMDTVESSETTEPEGDLTETPPEGTPSEPPATDQEPTTATPLDEIEIDGIGKVKVDELKKGYLRQSDYTRKTQEIAKQREEANDAIEMFNYLKSKPHLIAKLKEADVDPNNAQLIEKATPQYDMVREVFMNQKAMELDSEVNRLKSIYGEVDEVALYDQARELGLQPNKIEIVYKSLAYGNKPVEQQVPSQPQQVPDRDTIYAEIKAQILAELQQNKQSTGTIVSTPSAPITVPSESMKLTDEEIRVADLMRMSHEDYAKWKNK